MRRSMRHERMLALKWLLTGAWVLFDAQQARGKNYHVALGARQLVGRHPPRRFREWRTSDEHPAWGHHLDRRRDRFRSRS
jgi:hypothetical protein